MNQLYKLLLRLHICEQIYLRGQELNQVISSLDAAGDKTKSRSGRCVSLEEHHFSVGLT